VPGWDLPADLASCQSCLPLSQSRLRQGRGLARHATGPGLARECQPRAEHPVQTAGRAQDARMTGEADRRVRVRVFRRLQFVPARLEARAGHFGWGYPAARWHDREPCSGRMRYRARRTSTPRGGRGWPSGLPGSMRGSRNLAALAVAGSVGARIADRFSDLELDCYWAHPPAGRGPFEHDG
jgi:hypothetical protein